MIGKHAKRKPVICNLAGIYTANAFNPGAVVVIHAPRACSHLIAGALPYLKDGVDVVICDWMSVTDEKNFETAALDWVFEKRKKMEGLLYTTIMPSTCNKIFKKSLFLDNNVKYLEQKYEDLSANPLVLLKAETVKYIHKPYYNYYLRDNSLMRSKINPRQMVDALSYLDKKLKIEDFVF